ncbi:MAG: hypothetical protein Q7K40_03840 [bacterium]|nr:hypothetical protein [bacterium]
MKKKQPTSRDTYTRWAKSLPKGTQVKMYIGPECFMSVVQPNVMAFAYSYGKKKKKQ